jgi:hypothetical protein
LPANFSDLDRVCSQSTLSGISKKLSSMAAEPTASSRACCCISRGGSGERRKVALNELVVEALNLAYHGARAKDPNFDLTPRALRMTKDAPTGAATAATSDCWPNWVCEVRASSLRCGIVRWRFCRARRTAFYLARSSRDSDHSPTVIGNLRVSGQLLPSE